MKILFIILSSILIIPLSGLTETMDVNISNSRVENDSFKFEIQIKRTDTWDLGFGKIGGLGNSDFYFNNNSAAFAGAPLLSDIHPEITSHPLDFDIIVQINPPVNGQLQVKLTYTPLTFAWNPALNVYQELCSVAWKIANPTLNSELIWDETNSGFTDGDGDVITPTYIGDGNIALTILPVTSTNKVPIAYNLYQNYPNPFNPSTRIRFDVPLLKTGYHEMSLLVYNALGQLIKVLYQGKRSAGSFEIKWNGRDETGSQLPTGIYFAVFASNDYRGIVKLILLK